MPARPAAARAGRRDARELRDELVGGGRCGPAISCGKNETKPAKSQRLRSAGAAPRHTSIDVGERLERVEADAGRQDHVEPAGDVKHRGDAEGGDARFHRPRQQPRVLEVGEQAEVARQRDRQQRPSPRRRLGPLDDDRHPVVDDGGDQHRHDEPPVAGEGVEDDAGEGDPAQERLAAQAERHRQRQRQEEDQELERAKEHRAASLEHRPLDHLVNVEIPAQSTPQRLREIARRRCPSPAASPRPRRR